VTAAGQVAAVAARLRAAGCVFAEDEARLLLSGEPAPDALERMISQRVAGLPLEQVVGWAEFCGLRVAVGPGVFVPRRRTEFLAQQAVLLACQAAARHAAVRQAAATQGMAGQGMAGQGMAGQGAAGQGVAEQDVAAAAEAVASPVVVDLCCGSGALAAVVAAAVPDAEIHAADIDPAAVRCARRNLPGRPVYQGDLFGPLPAALRGRVDVLAANVPYVPAAEIRLLPPEAREHEPRVAHDGGGDGLDVLRRVAAGAGAWLASGGVLLTETSGRQVPAALAVMAGCGLVPGQVSSADLAAAAVTGTNGVSSY
jgi:release factor glutamine methyltransferase